MTTTERIKRLIINSGKSEYAIKKETGLGNSVLSDLKAGRAENPSVKTIKILAEYFNVSADYLLCLSDTPTPLNAEQTKKVVPVERLEMALLCEMPDLFQEQRFVDTVKLYNVLPDQYRERVLEFVVGIAVGLGINTNKILGR